MCTRPEHSLIGVLLALAGCAIARGGEGVGTQQDESAADTPSLDDEGEDRPGDGAEEHDDDGEISPAKPPFDTATAEDAGSGDASLDETSDAGSWTLESPTFASGDPLPMNYTCYAAGISPALTWTEPPAETESLALVLRQQDPTLQINQALWVIWDIPKDARALSEDLGATSMPESLPGAKQVSGTAARFGTYYQPPCPFAEGSVEFTLYALATPQLPEVETWMAPRQVAEALEASAELLTRATLEATLTPP